MAKKPPAAPAAGPVDAHARSVFTVGKKASGVDKPGKVPRPRRMTKIEAKVKDIDPPPTNRERVLAKWDDLKAMYIGGLSVAMITPELFGEALSVDQVRAAIFSDAVLRAEFAAVRELMADSAFDSVITAAAKCDKVGDYKAAGELWLKVAAKANSKVYGDKSTVAHTGGDGGPIEITPGMDAKERYEAMLRGAKLPTPP